MRRVIEIARDKDGLLDAPDACNESVLLAETATGGLYLVDVDPERIAELEAVAEVVKGEELPVLTERLPVGERSRVTARYQALRETVTERKPEPREARG